MSEPFRIWFTVVSSPFRELKVVRKVGEREPSEQLRH